MIRSIAVSRQYVGIARHRLVAARSLGTSPHVFVGKEENFDELVVESKVPVIIDVMAGWCPPCKVLGPILEKEVDAMNGKVKLVKIDSDEQPELARSLKVSALPTVFGVVGGKEIDSFVGFPGPQKVKDFVRKMCETESEKK